MLIEFSVTNFKSIRDRQTLSLVANNRDKKLPEHLIDVGLPGLSNTRLLKSLSIYGANASGKSNIIKAAMFMQDFVQSSATEIKPSEETGVKPFRLDSASENKPSEFEAIFVHEEVRYQYAFSLDKTRVFSETLHAYPHGQSQCWYTRHFDSTSEDYEWYFNPKQLKGDKRSLEEMTRPNGLFLSVAAQFSHEKLASVYDWFSVYLRFLDFSNSPITHWTTTSIIAKEGLHAPVQKLLSTMDLGVSGLEIKPLTQDSLVFPEEIPVDIKEDILKKIEDGLYDCRFLHRSTETGNLVPFETDEESAGTLKFFSLLGPWLTVLAKGFTLFIDEIAANMHPLLVRHLLKAINGDNNNSGAQLVFTTHDTNLLDTSILRRDQVWFTERSDEKTTVLYPLTDFQPRNDEALQKGYLAGRYGGIPFLQGEFSLK